MMRAAVLGLALAMASNSAFAAGVRDAIDKANAAWLAAYGRGDAAAIAKLYTENATTLPPGRDMVQGRAAIEALWADAIKAGWTNVKIDTLNVEGFGNAAREIGRFSLDAPAGQNETAHVEGKYVVVWKKTRVGWRLDTDIWNLNK